MKKRTIVLLIVSLSLASLVGCGNKKISNDMISINQYVGLEVSKPAEENAEQVDETVEENAEQVDKKDDEQTVKEFESNVWKELLANCTVVEYPTEELENLMKELELQYSYVIREDGKTSSELIEEIHGMTVEELAKEQLKKKYAVALIAEEEGLTLTDSEYETELAKLAEASGISSAEYENMFGYEKLYEKFQEDRVMEFLKENLQ